MKKRILIQDVDGFIGEKVKVQGWIHKIKSLGHVSFIQLRDKTGLLQLVTNDEEVVELLKLEMSISCFGLVSKNPKAMGGVEIQMEEMKIIGKVYYDLLPFSINQRKLQASLETQLDHRYMSLRRPTNRMVFKIQSEICQSFSDFFKNQGFQQIHTPKVLASGTEGGSELFRVKYFDKRAFLAQSPQFYKQMMVGSGFESVYEIGHAYRAELHNTWRHLNEYVSLDIETGFIKDEHDLMDLEEAFLKFLFTRLRESHEDIFKKLKKPLPKLVKIPRIPLKEVQEILLKTYDKRSPYGNIDAQGESLISEYVKEKYSSDFLFITKYPKEKRPMYTMPDDHDDQVTKSFDLIYKGLEITTGGQRIHAYLQLTENMEAFGVNPEDFDFYLEGFKFGMPPHGGFAIGLERITMQILDLDNIREACLLPRDMNRLMP